MHRLEDLERDPHLAATGFFRTLHDGARGAVRFPGAGVRFDGRPLDPKMPPRLGEHTREVLREAGLADSRIEALAATGAARAAQRPTKETDI
jgi:crotonobetainyl-CoA:carnitine CoA-transferase CaiB-like acyl-CoA transferase